MVGDRDTAVHFRSAESEWVRIPLETDDLIRNKVTLEALVQPTAAAANGTVVSGPVGPGAGAIYSLQQIAAGPVWRFGVTTDAGPTVVNVDGPE